MESPKKSFIATLCCAFCHELFPPQAVDDWRSNFRAVLCLDTYGESSIELTEPTHLPEIDGEIDITLTGGPRIRTIEISRDPRVSQENRNNRLAFCFHDWCYSNLIWKLKGCPTSVIYKLARSLSPDSSIWENICERRGDLDTPSCMQLVENLRKSRSDLDSTSRLQILARYESQPLFMSRLPVELRICIWEYAGLMTPYSAFILATDEASRLVRHLRYASSREIVLERGSHLSAKMITVFGIDYIQDLIVGKDPKGHSRPLGDTTKVKYITSLSGICAIQLLGIDWESDWIGKIPNVKYLWHGMIRGEISTIRCDYNDLNCTAISLAGPFPRKQVVWDQPDLPCTLFDPDATLYDTNQDNTKFGDTVYSPPTAPARRFFRYLSLYNGDEYTKGLSIYISVGGISGLEAHFTRTSRVSGYRSNCVLHFPLCPEERIAYAWLRMVNGSRATNDAPALTIQTTHGRIHTFGPYMRPCLVARNYYKWILLHQEGYIAGFYYENIKKGTRILSLGVTGDGTTARPVPLLPRYHNFSSHGPLQGTMIGALFLSVADLSDLKRVDVCYVDQRCTGMLIRYLNNYTVVLGQWHTSHVSQSSCIYDSSRPGVTHIYFRMSKSGDSQIVTGISFSPNTVEATPDPDYQVFRTGEHIAWWFTERWDKILRWEGDLAQVPEESTMKQPL